MWWVLNEFYSRKLKKIKVKTSKIAITKRQNRTIQIGIKVIFYDANSFSDNVNIIRKNKKR